MRRRREMSIETVQHWVLTALITAVASFPLGALTIVTHQVHRSEPSDAVMLCVMTAAIGLIAMVAILLIHKRSPWSPFLLLGLLPAIGSATWTWFA
jgi:hypothetical protein